MSRAPKRPEPTRSRIERAAIAVCKSIYHGVCACDLGKVARPCAAMLNAAYAVAGEVAPENMDTIKHESIELDRART